MKKSGIRRFFYKRNSMTVVDGNEVFVAEREALITSLKVGENWSVAEVRTFMESHVWAVWDFMSLVKALQKELTCVSVPWRPVGDPQVRRFINEIVWGEESDVDRDGNPTSHFEMYLKAMDGIGASSKAITSFLDELTHIERVNTLVTKYAPSRAVANFVKHTFEVIASGKLHVIAAVFTYGREDLIPDMFTSLVKDLSRHTDAQFEDLIYYLERHIEVDGDEHGPIALKLVEATIGGDPAKREEAKAAAVEALRLRKEMWKDIQQRIGY